MNPKELQLVGLGSLPAVQLREVEAAVAQVFGVQAYLSKASLPAPANAFNKTRNQYNSTALMRRLLSAKEAGASMILGVADIDLFEPDSAFLFGDFDRDAKVAVVSTHRLGNGENGKKRLRTEAAHQSGHLLGLSYCEDGRCLMSASEGLADSDRRELALCNNCKHELARLRG